MDQITVTLTPAGTPQMSSQLTTVVSTEPPTAINTATMPMGTVGGIPGKYSTKLDYNLSTLD